jgi:hypothetical protein
MESRLCFATSAVTIAHGKGIAPNIFAKTVIVHQTERGKHKKSLKRPKWELSSEFLARPSVLAQTATLSFNTSKPASI